jgi:hypothetical protein
MALSILLLVVSAIPRIHTTADVAAIEGFEPASAG